MLRMLTDAALHDSKMGHVHKPASVILRVLLAGLAPGRYVLRVEARAQVADAPTVSRELEVSIR